MSKGSFCHNPVVISNNWGLENYWQGRAGLVTLQILLQGLLGTTSEYNPCLKKMVGGK
jgi:hypothetical protein